MNLLEEVHVYQKEQFCNKRRPKLNISGLTNVCKYTGSRLQRVTSQKLARYKYTILRFKLIITVRKAFVIKVHRA